jgi:hypothetical protein
MNRKQRRATANSSGHDPLCPRCNGLAVILQAVIHDLPFVKSTVDDDGDRTVEVEIGPLFLVYVGEKKLARGCLMISLFGEEVFTDAEPGKMPPERPWLHMLAALRAELDAKFGRAAKTDHHAEATHEDEHPLSCQGPDFEDDAREHIAKSGQFILGVFGKPGELWFNYTIGNHERGLPELLIVYPGSKAGYERFGGILNDAGKIQRERGTPFEHGELVSLGGRLPVRIVDATARAKAEYTFGVGRYYETDDYQVRQLVVPDRDGRYPGDPLCAEPYASLPLLSPPAN